MTITGMQWFIIWGTGSKTVEVNFSAQAAVAQISLGEVDGGGLHNTGIRRFETRPSPGATNAKDFGNNWYTWPNTLFDQHLSSVTFGLVLGEKHQQATAVCNIFFWS
jgi:hypothetical protein